MSALLLAPHNDDETLFAAFTCLRYSPLVVVCLKSVKQFSEGYPGGPITALRREVETRCATRILGCEYRQLHRSDHQEVVDWSGFYDELSMVLEYEGCDAERVFAPAYEKDGHPHHNQLAALADGFFDDREVVHYLTYTNGRRRSVDGKPVEHPGEWVAIKREAMNCYESQIASPSTRHHFDEAGPEFYA